MLVKLLLAQLLIKSLASIIQVGTQESKDNSLIIIDAALIILIFSVYVMNYLEIQQLYLGIVIQLVCIIQLEQYFYTMLDVDNSMILVYVLAIQILMSKNNKFFQYFIHLIILYVSIRIFVQFYNELSLLQFLQLLVQQPFNHILIYLLFRQKKIKKIKLDSPPQQSRRIKQSSFMDNENKQEQIISESQKNLAINDDLLNCLPYGLALMTKDYQIVKNNSKMLRYLQVPDQEQIVAALDQLFQKAEQNNPKPSPNVKKFKHTIVPLRNIKQQSDKSQYRPSEFKQKNVNWISDRMQFKEVPHASINLKESVQLYSNLAQVLNELQHKTANQLNLNQSQTMTINSDLTNMMRYQATMEINDKTKNFLIRVYEVDQFSHSKDQIFLFIMENVTNKEKLKVMTNRFNFQQALLNSFSHELRTPLNCTLSLLQALYEKVSEEIQQNYLNPAIASSKRLLFQINDILDYAQIECKNFQLNVSEFQVSDIFMTIKELFQQECKQKQIELIMDGVQQVLIKNDRERVLQVLVNLINNSIKFTRQNGRIILSLKKRNHNFSFSVWDNGTGISADQLINLYSTSFFPNAEYLNQNKLGLGLKVSRGIVKYMCQDGELSIKSEEGSYTLISFQLEDYSLKEKEELEYLSDSVHALSQQDSIQRVYNSQKNFLVKQCNCVKILIVDDIPFNHIALSSLLQNFGLKADSAYDGNQAIFKVEQKINQLCCQFYKIIFMDIEMPGKNGFQTSLEITNYLKKELLEDSYVIVMCSAYSGEENLEKANKSGMKEIIPKPISMKILSNLINKYIKL